MASIDFKFKVIIIGPGAVGKTSLINRFVHNEFSLKYKFTIGVDFLSKRVNYDPNDQYNMAHLQLWDIGGQDRFKFLHRSFYEGANGVLLIFDLSRASTFTEMKDWLSEMYETIQEKIPMILVGNKADLIPEIGEVIDRNLIDAWVKSEKCVYLETSAKTGQNVEEAFIELTHNMVKKAKPS
jgi:small GTP-binding protein